MSRYCDFTSIKRPEKRRLELIRKVGLKSELENELVGQLANANDEIRSMASNPLFLNLLCEHIKNGHSFPKNVHTVFETYIGNRLTRDEKSVRRRFQLGISQIRSFAENIAFCMVADTGLGLSPTRENLKEAVKRLYNGVDENFESYLDALEFMKLGRSEEVLGAVQSKTFTFAHRRFQEYFATCVVLREPTRVSPHQLLCDARWRETAVVMFQTQPIQELRIYIAEADKLLNDHCSTISTLIASPLEYLLPESKHKTDDQNELLSVDFPWPSGCFHLLSLLQDGFTSRLIDLPEDIRMNISRLVLTATETGTLYDKKSSLEVAGTVPEPILVYLLRSAFANKSQWLREVAYRQVARLTNISPDIATGIRIAIVELAMFKRLRREQQATRAHIARINGSMDFLSVMLLLLFLPVIDISINVFLIILLVTISISANAISLSEILLLTILLSFSFLYLRVLISPFLYTLIPFWSNTVLLRRNSPLTFFYRTQSYFKNFSFRKVNNRNTKSKRNRRAFGKYFYHLLMPSIFWSIFLLTKFGLLLIPIYVLSRIHSKVLVGASLIFVVSYLLLFTPLALFAAVFGQFSRRRWWLLLPLWPLLYLLKNFKSIIKVSLKLIRECYFSVILLALFFSIYAILLIFIGNLLSDFTKSHERFMEYLGIISLCLFSLVFSIWIVREINKWIPDLFKWYRWTKMQKKPMTWQELVSNLCLYHTDLYRTRLLKFVCEKRLLIATEETETILKSLALETELKQKNNQVVEKDKILPIQVISPDSEKNITTKYSAIINNASSDFLDALYILIEDLHLMIVNI